MKPTRTVTAPRCVAVVMSRNEGSGGSGDRPGLSSVASGYQPENGYEIFRQFLSENQRIAWHPHVTYSIQSLDFVGFVRPGTLFVSGDERHLECLRSAWTRRLLKPPVGFTLKSVGDVGGIEIQEIPQTQFLSLPDVLCTIIVDLNRFGHPATVASIMNSLQQQYFGMIIPKEEVICTALGNLMAQGKLFCMGSHYFLATPNILPHHAQQHYRFLWGAEQKHVPFGRTKNVNVVYDTCSKECQTGDSIIGGPTSQPIKLDKAAVARTDLINPKAENAGSSVGDGKKHTGSEKVGLLARIFGRSKARNSQKGKSSDEAADAKEKGPTANAPNILTFSTQFPPPEWLPDSRYVRSGRDYASHQPIFSRMRRHRNGDMKVGEPMDSVEASGKAQRHSVWIDLDPVTIKRNRSDRRFTSHRVNVMNGRREVDGRAGGGRRSPSGGEGARGQRKQQHHRVQKYLSSSSECLVNGAEWKAHHFNADHGRRFNDDDENVLISRGSLRRSAMKGGRRGSESEREAVMTAKKTGLEAAGGVSNMQDKNQNHRSSEATSSSREHGAVAVIYSSPWKPAAAIKVCVQDKGENHDSALSSSPVISDLYSSDSKSGGYSPSSSGEPQPDSGRSSKRDSNLNGENNNLDCKGNDHEKNRLDHTYVNGIVDLSDQKNNNGKTQRTTLDHTYENLGGVEGDEDESHHQQMAGNETTQFETIDDDPTPEAPTRDDTTDSNGSSEVNSSMKVLQIRVSPTYISAV